jgi:hypothetical protein
MCEAVAEARKMQTAGIAPGSGDTTGMTQKQIDNDRSPRDTSCFTKAKSRGQTTFTLVEQDMSSPKVIAQWIYENIMTCPAEKLHAALDSAIEMRVYPKRKIAD